ncbi:hypothetical protein [Veillonella sp. R32]|nr:hypothetical protein [Veillonella sp. R32]
MVKDRIFYLDLLRTIAIILVVFTHAHDAAGFHINGIHANEVLTPLFF